MPELRRAVGAIVAAWLAVDAPWACANQPPKVEPADVFRKVGVVREELKSITFVMGRPKNRQPSIKVKGAQPREVYFQARTLFRKAERLCFDITRRRKAEPALPKTTPRPADVLKLVDAALERLRLVKEKLKIDKKADVPARDADRSPNDVFIAIVDANRQLNLLLDRRFTPSDVFQQVTAAVGYASRLLESFDAGQPTVKAPKHVPGKRPADVYRRLVKCYERIRGIALRSRVRMLEFTPDEKQIAQAEPSDVYDVAALLVSELAYLHSRLPGAKPPRKAFYPGRKFPSHVFQRAGILERQLADLEKRVAAKPDWLKTTKKSE